MGKLKLLLTADYEVFGNGTGRVDTCMIEPTNAMAEIAAAHNQRVTLFFEVCEYWAFRAVEDSGQFPADYKPATWIENQLRALVAAGHDVQLHFHPQWLEYQYHDVSNWTLKYDWWRLPMVPGGLGNSSDEKSLVGLFAKGKQTLETLLQPADSSYCCHAFRAGSWCIQPEGEVLTAMKMNGFGIDSTVAPGVLLDNNITYYDFTSAPRTLPQWQISTKVCEPDAEGPITEIPIFSSVMGTAPRLMFLNQRRKRGLKAKAPGCQGAPADATLASVRKPGKLERILTKLQSGHRMFDFCVASFEEMCFFANAARHKYKEALTQGDVPLVAIGHPKNFDNGPELQRFLSWVSSQDWIETDSLSSPSIWRGQPA